MFEKYFEYGLLIFVLGIFVLPYAFWRLYTRLRYLQKLARINVMKQQQKLPDKTFFSSDILNIAVKKLYFCISRKARVALVRLVGGKVRGAAEYFLQKQPHLSVLLTAHCDVARAYRQMEKRKNFWFQTPRYAAYFPILAHIMFAQKVFKTAMMKIQKLYKANKQRPLDAYFQYISAYVYLQEGDMLSASQNASAALKTFQKYRYSAEEARTYLLLAEIYRLSCVNDVAFSMLQSALKIYRTQKLRCCEAETIALIGRQFLFESRYDEAMEKYRQALKTAPNDNLKADIYNQSALVCIVQNNLAKADKFIKTALDISLRNKDEFRIAFTRQLLGHIAFNRQSYSVARRHFDAAAELYEKQQNKSAYLECLYLSAETYYKQDKYKASENVLRRILDAGELYGHSFHMANVYSLLGLIYVENGDYERAKALLLQSLNLEHSNNRSEGLSADYTNLAMIDAKCGNLLSARENLQTACEYARKTGNEELVALIENKLKPLT